MGGGIASELNFAGTYSSGTAKTGDLDVQYISEATKLENLRNGQGITRGEFRITVSSGASATVDLSQGDEITIGDVIDEINSKGLQITARVNDTGDGILIEDNGPGVVAISVEEKGSSTAASLGLLGTASAAGEDLDGSFETSIDILSTDTLQDVVDKITEANLDVKVSIINDGSEFDIVRLPVAVTAPPSEMYVESLLTFTVDPPPPTAVIVFAKTVLIRLLDSLLQSMLHHHQL